MVKVGDIVKCIHQSVCSDGLTVGKSYVVIELDNDPDFPEAVFINDDEGERNILFKNEYEVVR